MKRFTVLLSISIFSGFLLFACEPDGSVHAGNEEYKPRPASTADVPNTPRIRRHHTITGELVRVDLQNRTLGVRLDSRVESYKFNDCTEVEGIELPEAKASKTDTSNRVPALVGKEGSEVTVQWGSANGAQLALVIEVTPVRQRPVN
jgi:hypothetical protein